MAGFDHSETEECDSAYLQFTWEAAKSERSRCERLRAAFGMQHTSSTSNPNRVSPPFPRETATSNTLTDGDDFPGSMQGTTNTVALVPNGCEASNLSEFHRSNDAIGKGNSYDKCPTDNECRHDSYAFLPNDSSDDKKGNKGMSNKRKKDICCPNDCSKNYSFFEGRHMHQLESKCGHRPIIHQPKDGPVHVDFVVQGKKVECYQEMKPLVDNSVLWPSKFSCDELKCDPKQHEVKCCDVHDKDNREVPGKKEPKVFDLDDIDIDGDEWDLDYFSPENGECDGTLLGLMKLGGVQEE